MGIHRTWVSGLEPFIDPPAGRARSPPGWPPEDILPPKDPKPAPRSLGGLSANSLSVVAGAWGRFLEGFKVS
jgi:hypothetical protein